MIKKDSMLETCNVFPISIMILGLLYNLGLSETTNKGSAPQITCNEAQAVVVAAKFLTLCNNLIKRAHGFYAANKMLKFQSDFPMVVKCKGQMS